MRRLEACYSLEICFIFISGSIGNTYWNVTFICVFIFNTICKFHWCRIYFFMPLVFSTAQVLYQCVFINSQVIMSVQYRPYNLQFCSVCGLPEFKLFTIVCAYSVHPNWNNEQTLLFQIIIINVLIRKLLWNRLFDITHDWTIFSFCVNTQSAITLRIVPIQTYNICFKNRTFHTSLLQFYKLVISSERVTYNRWPYKKKRNYK